MKSSHDGFRTNRADSAERDLGHPTTAATTISRSKNLGRYVPEICKRAAPSRHIGWRYLPCSIFIRPIETGTSLPPDGAPNASNSTFGETQGSHHILKRTTILPLTEIVGVTHGYIAVTCESSSSVVADYICFVLELLCKLSREPLVVFLLPRINSRLWSVLRRRLFSFSHQLTRETLVFLLLATSVRFFSLGMVGVLEEDSFTCKYSIYILDLLFQLLDIG
mmetsp:Transcript_21078/g.60424  ORF Transcript_21078/g.60424 Transcript_21078/m.60424 type:complete len:222 (-) Transcript_21078:2269-2934(-)